MNIKVIYALSFVVAAIAQPHEYVFSTASGEFEVCCQRAGLTCINCRTYECCRLGCQAGRDMGVIHPCMLVNCQDQCAANFPFPEPSDPVSPNP